MTIRERILAYLQAHPEGVDDDALAEALQLKRRQQANSRCRQLAEEGLVRRLRVGDKICNFPAQDMRLPPAVPTISPLAEAKPWFWEGHVQAAIVAHLRQDGYVIQFEADTASHQTGKDIEAEKEGVPLWVTVKGYPEGKKRTHPATQARHWFKQAVFDIIVWRGISPTAHLALALPDYITYRRLAEKIAWFQETAQFTIFWVQASGVVLIET